MKMMEARDVSVPQIMSIMKGIILSSLGAGAVKLRRIVPNKIRQPARDKQTMPVKRQVNNALGRALFDDSAAALPRYHRDGAVGRGKISDRAVLGN